MMRKYWALYKVSVQNTITYRGPLIVWMLANLIGLATVLAVWLVAKADGPIGGYSRPELITYYIFALFLSWLVQWMPFYWIKDEIANGEIVGSTLLKPVSYYFKVFAHEAGWHTVSVVLGLTCSLLISFFIGSSAVWHFTVANTLVVFAAIVVAIAITMTASLCLGLVAFWTTKVGQLDALFWMGRMLLGGQGIPVSFFPSAARFLVYSLPFRYMFSFPIELYLGKITSPEIFQGFAIATAWFFFFIVLYKWLWTKGRLAYTSFGQ